MLSLTQIVNLTCIKELLELNEMLFCELWHVLKCLKKESSVVLSFSFLSKYG